MNSFNMDYFRKFLNKYFSRDQLKKRIHSMKLFWKELPEQIRRLSIVSIILVILPFIVRYLLIPSDFGEYGHYRASAVKTIISQEIQYAGHQICYDCHDDIVETKKSGYHKNVSCEVCHGPAARHTDDDEVTLIAPRQRGYCPLCHEYLPSRPTGFPQIVSASHNPMKACISCHEAHDPKPPKTPQECNACHAEIASTKSLSKHVYIPCVRCHQTPEEHKINPREVLPTKPINREFCGSCHSQDADANKDIPRIDMQTHEESYVCWQCHYPHLPETQ